MELLAQWFAALVKTIPAFLLNPFTYVGIVLVIMSWRKQQGMERKLFGTRLHRPEDVLPRQLGSGLIAGACLSIILLLSGVVLSPAAFLLLWVIALLLSLMGIRFLSFAYAGGLLALANLITGHISLPEHPWLAWLWTSLHSIHLPSLYLFLALLYLTQAVLLWLGKTEHMTPVWLQGKRGKTVGGYLWQPIWIVPIVSVSPRGEPLLPYWSTLGQVTSVDPLYQSWPLVAPASELTYGLILLPAAITFSARITSSSPQDYLRFSARWLLGYALILLVMGWVAISWSWVSVLALLLTVLGYETLYWVLRYREEKGRPSYMHPPEGIKIMAVIPNTPAAKMGLKPGEVVVKVNGQPIHQSEQLYEALSKNKAFCKLEVINAEGESKFPQCSLYADDHHQLGLILAPDHQGASWRNTVLMD